MCSMWASAWYVFCVYRAEGWWKEERKEGRGENGGPLAFLRASKRIDPVSGDSCVT